MTWVRDRLLKRSQLRSVVVAGRWSPGASLCRLNSDCKGRRFSTVSALAAFL
jgi:hypothetical protein